MRTNMIEERMPLRPYFSVQVALTLLCLFGHLITSAFGQHWTLVDDTDPAISYSGIWFQGPCGPSCLYPNLTNVYNETWHATWPSRSTGDSSFTFQFTGYAVVVGGILDDVDADVATSLVITLDGQNLRYYRDSANDGTILTNGVVFNSAQLEKTLHTITVDVAAESFFALDYIAFQDLMAGESPPVTTTTTSDPPVNPPSSTPSAILSGTSTTSSKTSSSGTATTTDTLTRGTTSFDPSTLTVNNILAHTIADISTSTDSSGHTFLIPVTTDAGDDPADPAYSTHSHGTSNDPSGALYSNTTFSPALAGAIGAAVAALAAVLIVLVIFWCRKRKAGKRVRPSDAEPYMLAASATPSTASSNLSPPLSPMPYSPESVLGLFVGPQAIPDHPHHQHQLDLLSSPPPNTLSSPISPNQPYPYPVTHKIISSSSNRGLTPRRQQLDMSELRSPVTPATLQRPTDWDIEGQQGEQYTPVTSTPSPLVTTPSTHPSRRRSGRQKEQLDPSLLPPPPNVPVLRQPSGLMRSRRGTNGNRELPNVNVIGEGARGSGSGVGSDEESLPPVVRRQSLTHPAPPAYSPPRLVRNADLHDV